MSRRHKKNRNSNGNSENTNANTYVPHPVEWEELPESLRTGLWKDVLPTVRLMLATDFQIWEVKHGKYRLCFKEKGMSAPNLPFYEGTTINNIRKKFFDGVPSIPDEILFSNRKTSFTPLPENEMSEANKELCQYFQDKAFPPMYLARIASEYGDILGKEYANRRYIVFEALDSYIVVSNGKQTTEEKAKKIVDKICKEGKSRKLLVNYMMESISEHFDVANELLSLVPVPFHYLSLPKEDDAKVTRCVILEDFAVCRPDMKIPPAVWNAKLVSSDGSEEPISYSAENIVGTPSDPEPLMTFANEIWVYLNGKPIPKKLPTSTKKACLKMAKDICAISPTVFLNADGPSYELVKTWVRENAEGTDSGFSMDKDGVKLSLSIPAGNPGCFVEPYSFAMPKRGTVMISDGNNKPLPVSLEYKSHVPSLVFSDSNYPWCPCLKKDFEAVGVALQGAKKLWDSHPEIDRYREVTFWFTNEAAGIDISAKMYPPLKCEIKLDHLVKSRRYSDFDRGSLDRDVDILLRNAKKEYYPLRYKLGELSFDLPPQYRSPLFLKTLSIIADKKSNGIILSTAMEEVKKACPEYTKDAIRDAVDLAFSQCHISASDGTVFPPFTNPYEVSHRYYSYIIYYPEDHAAWYAEYTKPEKLTVRDLDKLSKQGKSDFVGKAIAEASTPDDVMALIPLLEQMTKVFRKSVKKAHLEKFTAILTDPTDQILLETVLDS